MLNISSNHLSQLAQASEDGATVSQAITYYSQVLQNGQYTWRDWYYPMQIHMGYIIPAGTISLETPNIMFKEEIETSDDPNLPTEFALYQNYPNPFNPETKISFALPEASEVRIDIYNIMGQKVATIAEGPYEAGTHNVTWDGSQSAIGIYFYKLISDDFSQTRKMILLKYGGLNTIEAIAKSHIVRPAGLSALPAGFIISRIKMIVFIHILRLSSRIISPISA